MLIENRLLRSSEILVNGDRSSGVPRAAANAESSLMLEGYLSRGCAVVYARTAASIRRRAVSARLEALHDERRHAATKSEDVTARMA